MDIAELKTPFFYKARALQGKLVQGRLEASGTEEVERYLDRQGYYPVSVKAERFPNPK